MPVTACARPTPFRCAIAALAALATLLPWGCGTAGPVERAGALHVVRNGRDAWFLVGEGGASWGLELERAVLPAGGPDALERHPVRVFGRWAEGDTARIVVDSLRARGGGDR